MSDSWHSYPSIFAMGHRALKELFLDPVIVEEKEVEIKKEITTNKG